MPPKSKSKTKGNATPTKKKLVKVPKINPDMPDFMVIEKQGSFTFMNCDTYEGGYLADLRKKSIIRQGYGVYTTVSGMVFDGIWKDDKFTNDDKNRIIHEDGSIYEGVLSDVPEYVSGKYTFADNSMIECKFRAIKPDKNLIFSDPDGFSDWDQKLEDNVLMLMLPSSFRNDDEQASIGGT